MNWINEQLGNMNEQLEGIEVKVKQLIAERDQLLDENKWMRTRIALCSGSCRLPGEEEAHDGGTP